MSAVTSIAAIPPSSGQPEGSTLTYVQWLYNMGFKNYYLGYASALAVIRLRAGAHGVVDGSVLAGLAGSVEQQRQPAPDLRGYRPGVGADGEALPCVPAYCRDPRVGGEEVRGSR